MSSWYPRAKLSVIAHSIGGVVTGFVTSPPKIERMLLISPHTGFFGDYQRAARWRMFLLWHFMMPVVTRTLGYFPGRRLGFPEDLPYEVALEWGRRRRPHNLYLDGSIAKFDHIDAPTLVLRPMDDPFATTAAMERVKQQFKGATFLDVLISSDSMSPREIGHFGFFRSRNRQRLWPIALKWLMKGIGP
jgi:predicted alpha/beta hydrolase